ncbi:MAG: caspase family protein [Nannocystaceae bacterium]
MLDQQPVLLFMLSPVLGCTLWTTGVTRTTNPEQMQEVLQRERGAANSKEDDGVDVAGVRGANRADAASGVRLPTGPPIAVTPELKSATRAYAHRVALVIGIDEYGNGIPGLSSAVTDARRMADTFRSLGFDSVYELYDQDAERAHIVDFLRHGISDKVGANDLLVVYFAGHGMLGENGESYLLAKDSSSDVARDGLSMQYLKEAALGLDVRAVLYLVDACLSGAMMRRKGDASQQVADEHWREARRNRVVQVISAGRAEESALESRREGLFTSALRVGLLDGRADMNGDSVITTEELGTYASDIVATSSSDRQHPQWGTIEGSGTILMYDIRRVPGGVDHLFSLIPREVVPGIADELKVVHRLIDSRMWGDAELKLRDLLVDGACAELYLLLAEVYLETGFEQRGAFKYQAVIERELREAEKEDMTDNQKKRLFEIRRSMKLIVRGGY